ncbi:hypothetical protein [Brachybacterium sp. ACRRE]|uniref:hypothetical protein n=1 Tax=Brachybacterium sp. ACRRE TaxID=2918184 RepID=UPI001EF259EF|nr:hypothetical protein [Brachybacterium sp. ACRRE]MCG7308301.1 hypothetical protein [Brachybacterium sp. ACRRE]
MSTDGADGSIYFPARLHSAEEHLQWWSSVPVPDEVLQSVMDDYAESRTATIGAMVGGKWQAPPRRLGWSQAEYEARAREDADRHNEVVRRWQQQIPKELDRFAVRDAVRTHLAWTYRYTLPNDEQQQLETTQVTVGDYTGTPAEISTRYAMPGFAARHPEGFTRLPDDNTDLKRQLEQLRREVSSVATTTQKMYAGDMADHGYSSEQIDAELRGEDVKHPVGGRKALRSFKKD